MQEGSLVGSDVMAYTSRVLVNGVQRPAYSWSVSRALSGDLPEQVVAASGITQATGSVAWASSKDVADRPSQPWNPVGWMPAKGDRVEIFAGDGVSEWKQFHGVVDRTTGDLEGGFTSTLIDDFDRLSAAVSHAAMLRSMPPLAVDGSEPYRSAGLHPAYYVDYALRQAGFFVTPPREHGVALHAPLQGSLWGHTGTLSKASGMQNTLTPWGFGGSLFDAEWVPWGDLPTMTGVVQVSMMVAPAHNGAAFLSVDYGSTTDRLSLTINASRVAIASKNGVEVCRVTLGGATAVSMLAKSGTISLRTNTGATSSGAFTASGTAMSKVRLTAEAGASVAGVQVSHPSTIAQEHLSTQWVPNARIDTSSVYLSGIIDSAPTVDGVPAADLLDQISKATLSAMWIDEMGVMQWVPSDALRARASARTVTTLDDVFSLDWEDGLLGTASKVTVKYERPSITKSRWRTTVLAQGGDSQSLKSGDEAEIFLEPESGSHWIMPSYNFLEVGGSGDIWGSANNPVFSLVGLYYSADGGTTTIPGLSCMITTAQLGIQKAIVKYIAGSWPSDVEGVLSTSPTNGNLWPKNRNKALPRIVGGGVLSYTSQEVTATGAGGPGPELVHDMGVWAARTDSTEFPDRFASYLQSQTSTPQPVITGLLIVPDPRLQLGDVITIESGLIGATIRALITGLSTSHADSGMTTSVSVRVISVTVDSVTFEQWNSLGAPLTFEQLNALAAPTQTFTQFNTEA